MTPASSGDLWLNYIIVIPRPNSAIRLDCPRCAKRLGDVAFGQGYLQEVDRRRRDTDVTERGIVADPDSGISGPRSNYRGLVAYGGPQRTGTRGRPGGPGVLAVIPAAPLPSELVDVPPSFWRFKCRCGAAPTIRNDKLEAMVRAAELSGAPNVRLP
jgi:hypothetical protein